MFFGFKQLQAVIRFDLQRGPKSKRSNLVIAKKQLLSIQNILNLSREQAILNY